MKRLEYHSDKIHLAALISPGCSAGKSDLDVAVHPGVHVLPDAHPHGSGALLGQQLVAFVTFCTGWWPGRERDQQEPVLQASTTLPSHSEMAWGMLREPAGMLRCARRDKMLSPDCPCFVRVTGWSDIAGLFSCCLNTVGRKDEGRYLLARSYEQLCQARAALFRCFNFPS